MRQLCQNSCDAGTTRSDPAERPVLLWIDRADDGETANTRAPQALVDQHAFLTWQLGIR